MIIKITLHKKQYTPLIQKFFDDNAFLDKSNYSTDEEYKEFLEDIKNYKADFEKRTLKPKLEVEIKKAFINYINNISNNKNWKAEKLTAGDVIENKEHILENLEVKIKELVFDISFNETVVYYFESVKQYIII